MDNDYSDQINNQNSVNQIDEEKNIDFQQKRQSNTNLASKRPIQNAIETLDICLLYTSPSPRDGLLSRMPSSA